MLALVFVLLSFLLGLFAFLRLRQQASWRVTFSTSYIFGTLVLTWLTYLAAYAFRNTAHPLAYGNGLSLSLALVTLVLIRPRSWRELPRFTLSRGDWFFTAVTFSLCVFLEFYTFRIVDNHVVIGASVWSDFGPHLSMIRSFSLGSNFPTSYPHFADGTVRYHFLFQFLVGNLEYLGFPIDWAFNVPSALTLFCFFLLLFEFTVVLTGSELTAWIAAVLFFFRSSLAFWTYLADSTTLGDAFRRIVRVDHFIGRTQNENWGLWAQNVYINQRHLAFSLCLMLLVFLRIAQKKTADWKEALVLGVALGLIGFWNGAVVVATLAMLAVLALFSKRKHDFILIAALTLIFVFAETRFFIGQGSAVKPQWNFGFLAADRSVLGVLKYFVELLGFFLPLVALAFWKAASTLRRWGLAFLAPIAIATTLQLTPDINMNHKFVIISVVLLNILIASFLSTLWKRPSRMAKTVVATVLFLLTCTGVVDFFTVLNVNAGNRAVRADQADPVRRWIVENTDPHALFLTHEHVLNPVLLAGRKLYYGWPYFTWSAGYNTLPRHENQKQIYSATEADALRRKVRTEKIDYITVEPENVRATAYKLNEALLRQTFPQVYENTERSFRIYKTGGAQ